jgi:hypothetical protein
MRQDGTDVVVHDGGWQGFRGGILIEINGVHSKVRNPTSKELVNGVPPERWTTGLRLGRIAGLTGEYNLRHLERH